MDFAYSPHSEAGGTLHLPSPTHPHSYRIDGFPSIRQLRSSLSRSPSKPSRFQLHTSKSPNGSPRSPLSPLAFSKVFSPRVTAADPVSPPTAQPSSTTKKSKFAIRRSAPLRSSPRTRSSPKSPMKRALSDSTTSGNVIPSMNCRSSGEEDAENHGDASTALQETDTKTSALRFELNERPINFEFARSKSENSAPGANCLLPIKSSPLKRSDGIMNLDPNFGSPVAKRRSLHAGFGSEFDIFNQISNLEGAEQESGDGHEKHANAYSFSSPAARRSSPPRKFSLRKSTIQQRHGTGAGRSRMPADQSHEFAVPGLAASKMRQRMSLDSSLPSNGPGVQSPFRRTVPLDTTHPFSQQIPHRPGPSQPHPLSKALTPSSSASSPAVESHPPTPAPAPAGTLDPTRPPLGFSRSLPIGAPRPTALRGFAHDTSSGLASDFATPEAYKMAKPHPAAFMSTGLISKRNRDADAPAAGSFAAYAMPDTPSKRVSFPPMTGTPFRRSVLSQSSQPRHEFGTPSTPFSSHQTKSSPESFGKNVSIFGTRIGDGKLQRRGSFVSIDGDENSHSPSGQMESQSSNDELPPTPTKANGGGRRSKENSLRSSLFGRRTSLGPDTFIRPDSIDIPSPKEIRKSTPVNSLEVPERTSPHTPQEAFAPPDPSGLSISQNGHQGSGFFNSSFGSFPPATPTGPRDQPFHFGNSQIGVAPIAGLTQNDVDTALTSRFGSVTVYGNGEFSQVFRVEKPLVNEKVQSLQPSDSVGSVWAVKKTKRPYAGAKDRERKMREANILQALRGHDHVIGYTDHWESNGHLYIQTEFCENGNMKDFLTQTGSKGRLDGFRIWKILLELSLGLKFIHDSGFIHLDLKPANVFIDWEGVLKIGDFGLAVPWPAPRDIDGEGDREYISPEVLSGRFDKPVDIFALGMIMLEIAGNVALPDNGASWQRLRSGDMSDVPSLTWSSESDLPRDESGDPIDFFSSMSREPFFLGADGDEDSFGFLRAPVAHRNEDLVKPPNFMVDPEDNEALDKVVQWMISPQPDERPAIDEVYHCGGVQWVEKRRRAGATIYEGNWGPADDVLNHEQDVDMVDAD